MKHTRLALAFVVTSLAATPVIAASLTMVQFGSFETRAEAEKRLAEISKKYDASVGKLASNIREVKLPPDNLTVYRTQAGPVENRAAAQAICSQLASGGDECYIVQTAMVAAVPVEAKTEVAQAVPDLTSKLSTLGDATVRDPLNRQALASVSAAAAPVALVSPAEPSSQMQAALDKAVAEQPTAAAAVAQATDTPAAPTLPRRDFWSRLNPFSSEESAKPAPAVVAAEPVAVPTEAVQAAVLEVPAPVLLPKDAPVFAAPVITQAEPLRLPPPPAPLKAQSMAVVEKLPTPEPIATGTLGAPTPAMGMVQVEEAKRVPVTSATLDSSLTAAPVMAVPMLQPPVSLRPSATDGQKTVWAQVGPFVDGDAALAFWANYRQNHPDFPVVRVRVTMPYMQQIHASSQTWLRVGPVTKVAFIRNLCNNLAPQEDEKSSLRCGVVTDLPSSIAPKRGSGFLPPSRYSR